MRGLWAGATPTVMRNGTNQMCLFWAKNRVDGCVYCLCGGAIVFAGHTLVMHVATRPGVKVQPEHELARMWCLSDGCITCVTLHTV